MVSTQTRRLICAVSILLSMQFTYTAAEFIPSQAQCSNFFKAARNVSTIGVALFTGISAYNKFYAGENSAKWEAIQQVSISFSEVLALIKLLA